MLLAVCLGAFLFHSVYLCLAYSYRSASLSAVFPLKPPSLYA